MAFTPPWLRLFYFHQLPNDFGGIEAKYFSKIHQFHDIDPALARLDIRDERLMTPEPLRHFLLA